MYTATPHLLHINRIHTPTLYTLIYGSNSDDGSFINYWRGTALIASVFGGGAMKAGNDGGR